MRRTACALLMSGKAPSGRLRPSFQRLAQTSGEHTLANAVHECGTDMHSAQRRNTERGPGGGGFASCTVGRSFGAFAHGAPSECNLPALKGHAIRTRTNAAVFVQERAIALTSSTVPLSARNAQVQNAPAALRTARPQAAAGATFAVPQAAHRPAAFAAPSSFNLNDDWDALQFEQMEAVMAAAGALGTSAAATHATMAPGAAAALDAAPLGAASDTQAVQMLALPRAEAAAMHSI